MILHGHRVSTPARTPLDVALMVVGAVLVLTALVLIVTWDDSHATCTGSPDYCTPETSWPSSPSTSETTAPTTTAPPVDTTPPTSATPSTTSPNSPTTSAPTPASSPPPSAPASSTVSVAPPPVPTRGTAITDTTTVAPSTELPVTGGTLDLAIAAVLLLAVGGLLIGAARSRQA